jgi:hypothetical protein
MEQTPFARTKRRHKLKFQKEGRKMRGIKALAVVGLAVALVGALAAPALAQGSCAPSGPFRDWVLGSVGTASVIVIAIDNSGSVQQANRLPTEKQCAISIVQTLAGKQFAILAFNASVSVVQGLTTNTTTLVNAINSIQDTSNNTLMDGAIDDACQFTRGRNGALVLETDGIPTAARRPTDPLTAARQAAQNFQQNCSILAVIGVDVDAEGAAFLRSIASPGAYWSTTVPTLTEWGLIALGLLLAGSLAVMIRRRFARPAAAA